MPSPDAPKLLRSVGIALLLCYVAVSRARGGGVATTPPSARAGSVSSNRKRPRKRVDVEQEGVECEGLVDLIRHESQLCQDEELPAPSCLTREQLGEGRLVVVIVGPGSTSVHQSYVVKKLLRYLRWSNLVRRHFRIAQDQDVSATPAEARPPGLPREGGVEPMAERTDSEQSSSSEDRENRCIRSPGGAAVARPNGSSAHGNGGVTKRGAPSGARPEHGGYNFSDRGKAAALATIAAQESAKKVASWLNGLNSGGVAVVEAGRSGWASTRHGREALPGFLRQTTPPGVGILWVELLPSGLYHTHVSEPSRALQTPALSNSSRAFTPGVSSRWTAPAAPGNGAAGGATMAEGDEPGAGLGSMDENRGASWKAANGLARGMMPRGPGGNVVDMFLLTGNLVGAGGHVIYESVRGGVATEKGGAGSGQGGGSRGGGKDKGTSCFVSLADQGLDVQRQLEDEACPLLRRVGTFAAALRMKKSWHGCPVYLTRHGESLGNKAKSMGGDGRLSETGDRYAGVLADFVAAQPDAAQSRLLVWCSPMKRAAQTARAVKCHRYTQWEALTELDTGVFNGYPYEQVEKEYPDEFFARETDKLRYRYPEGEGYLDVVNRLDPVVVALEMEDRPVLVVSHQAVLRCLYAYFHDIPLREMPHIPISLHTVVKLTPVDYHHHPEAEAGAAGTTAATPPFWKELRFELIKQTPLEQLAAVGAVGFSAINGGKARRKASQLGERLS